MVRVMPLYPPMVAPPVKAAAIDGMDIATTKKMMVAKVYINTIGIKTTRLTAPKLNILLSIMEIMCASKNAS